MLRPHLAVDTVSDKVEALPDQTVLVAPQRVVLVAQVITAQVLLV